MENWRLLDLGKAEPYTAQAFYEAVAEAVHRGLSPNTLIFVQPASPYACIGYHQDYLKEIDAEYVESMGLPVVRRSQGGGATYLDSGQVFYQYVGKDTRVMPRNVDKMFRKLLEVTVEGYRSLGVPADFKPLNDVVVEGKKISGNGAGVHESAQILVGNYIMDLDYALMARVLRVPDEKFRDKMAKSMEQWVSTLSRELGESPSPGEVKEAHMEAFQRIMGVTLTAAEPSMDELRIFREETLPRHMSREWLHMHSDPKGAGRSVKIAHDVKVVEVDHKAGKLIRLRAEVEGLKLLDLSITGDLFVVPKEAVKLLERELVGAQLEEAELAGRVNEFYRVHSPESPGVSPGDYVDALMKLRGLL